MDIVQVLLILKLDIGVCTANFIKRRKRCEHAQMKTGINYTNKQNVLYDSFSIKGKKRSSKFPEFARVGRQNRQRLIVI
jgi:hypothetical protein